MNEKNIKNSESGISMYMTIVMMAVLFTMVLGVTVIIIRGSDILKGASDSIKAFHAADTGIERALYNIRVDGTCTPQCVAGNPCFVLGAGGDANWSYFLEYSACSPSSININAKGTFYESQRKIEVSY